MLGWRMASGETEEVMQSTAKHAGTARSVLIHRNAFRDSASSAFSALYTHCANAFDGQLCSYAKKINKNVDDKQPPIPTIEYVLGDIKF